MCSVYAQQVTSRYTNLPGLKIYAVNLGYETKNDDTVYFLNGQPVGKEIYQKYDRGWNDFGKCCPCLLETYDINDVLLSEIVSCTDCMVGSYKEFYPSGTTKLAGQFKENNSGSWNDIYDRGFCNVYDGEWNYFKEDGQVSYSEFWNKGKFVRQVPEQDSTEIWKTELVLAGKVIDTQYLTPGQVPQLIINLFFKNKSRKTINLSVRMTVSALNYRSINQSFTLEEFKKMDLFQLIRESGFPPGTEASFYLLVLNNDKQLQNFRLNVLY